MQLLQCDYWWSSAAGKLTPRRKWWYNWPGTLFQLSGGGMTRGESALPSTMGVCDRGPRDPCPGTLGHLDSPEYTLLHE